MENKEEHKINKAFKEKFENFEVPSRNFSFDDIYAQAFPETDNVVPIKRKSYRFTYAVAASISVILILFSLIFVKWRQQEVISQAGILHKEKDAIQPQRKSETVAMADTAPKATAITESPSSKNKVKKVTSTSTGNRIIRVLAENHAKRILLPDSSEILLNKGASLSYSVDFSHQRKVDLKGEAFFDVKKKNGKNFIISTPQSEIEVLGTSFNVNCSSVQEVVSVMTGKVKVSGSQRSVILLPGKKSILANGDVAVYESDINEMAWRTRSFDFKGQKLKEVLPLFENYFSITFEVVERENLNCSFTGKFSEPTLQEIITILETTLNLHATVKNNIYYLEGSGCN